MEKYNNIKITTTASISFAASAFSSNKKGTLLLCMWSDEVNITNKPAHKLNKQEVAIF